MARHDVDRDAAVEKADLNIPLKESLSVKMWDQYFRRVRRILQPVPRTQREEMALELQAHIMESFRTDAAASEPERLMNALERLGDPEDFLKPMVSDKLLIDASSSLNPFHVALGLWYSLTHSLGRGLTAVFAGLGYILSVTFGLIALLKPIFPSHVGMLRTESGSFVLGVSLEAAKQDILGYWIIPLSLAASVLCYILLTKGLKMFVRR